MTKLDETPHDLLYILPTRLECSTGTYWLVGRLVGLFLDDYATLLHLCRLDRGVHFPFLPFPWSLYGIPSMDGKGLATLTNPEDDGLNEWMNESMNGWIKARGLEALI